jgi:hypothetical protein
MQLKYSDPRNVPFIEFEDGSKLIFSTLLEHRIKGFHYMSFSGRNTTSVCVSGKGARKKKYYDTSEDVSFVTDMSLTSIDKRVRGKKGPLTPITLGLLRKLFKRLVSEDGYMSRKSLNKLEKIFNELNNVKEDTWDDDPTANGDEWG